MALITRNAAESTIGYVRLRLLVMPDHVYQMEPATLIWWLETVIALHQALETAGVAVPEIAAEGCKE